MANANVLINNFNSGELSELIESRSDLSKYAAGCKTLQNAIPLVEGGARKMPGTIFAGIAACGGPLGTASNGKSRLVPFTFSTDQTLILEFFGASSFTGSIAGNTLTVTEVSTGLLFVGSVISGAVQATITALGSGTGGDGTYTIGGSPQTVTSQTLTGSGGIRFWLNGGLVVGGIAGILNYSPTTTYAEYPATPSEVLLGPFLLMVTDYPGPGPTLCVQAPYGQGNALGVGFSLGVNSSDTLSVTKVGSLGSQSIQILLANATSSKNASSAIQTALQALGTINSSVSVASWLAYWLPTTVTPPITLASTYGADLGPGGIFSSTVNSNLGNFPGSVGAPPSGDWQPFTPPTGPVIVPTPYLAQDLFALDVSTQSADVLYIAHANYPPATLNRYSDETWIYTPISQPTGTNAPSPGQLYGTVDVVKTGYSALGQSISLISQASTCVVVLASSPSSQPFNDGDRIYINECAGMVELNEGQFLVSGISYGSVTVTVIDSSGTSSTITATGWQLTLIDPTTNSAVNSSAYLQYAGGGFAVAIPALFCGPGNYPACVTLYQERLCLGGALNTPTQINGSVQDDYPDFICDPNEDDYAIQFTLVSQQVNPIRWMIGTPTALMLGTAGGVWAMFTSDGQSLSQTDVTAALQTTIGVGNVAPQLVNSDVIWITRSARIVRLLLFNFVTNQWEGPDLTRLNRQITQGPTEATSGLVQTAFQSEPYPILWAVRADGQLIGLTYERQDEVFAWFRVVTDGVIESVACISEDNAEDQVWISVLRTINGVEQRYIEYFAPQDIFHQLSNAFLVHAGLQFQGVGPSSITGITQSNPAQVTAPGHGLTNGMSVSISGVLGMTQANTDPLTAWTVTGATTNTFLLEGINSELWGIYTSGGSAEQVTNQVSGMTYLLGKSVIAVGDEQVVFQATVTGDIVNFGSYCNSVTIGLPYRTIIQPMNPILGSQQATSKGKKQKFTRVTLSLYESVGGLVGTDYKHLHSMLYGTNTLGNPPTLFTGNITRDIDGEWEDEDTILIVHDDPYPFTLRSVTPRLSVAQEG